jgi:hypothetical protein
MSQLQELLAVVPACYNVVLTLVIIRFIILQIHQRCVHQHSTRPRCHFSTARPASNLLSNDGRTLHGRRDEWVARPEQHFCECEFALFATTAAAPTTAAATAAAVATRTTTTITRTTAAANRNSTN